MNIENFQVDCRGLGHLHGFQAVNISLLTPGFLILILSQMNRQVLFPQLQSLEAPVTFTGSDQADR